MDFNDATALRIYSEANRSDFVINIKENWEEGGQIADQSAMSAGEGYMELPLTEDLRNRLANASHWMIQFNKEAGDPFNVTDIVLVGDFGPDDQAIDNVQNGKVQCAKVIENGQVIILKNGIKYNALGVQLK